MSQNSQHRPNNVFKIVEKKKKKCKQGLLTAIKKKILEPLSVLTGVERINSKTKCAYSGQNKAKLKVSWTLAVTS